MTWFFVDDNLDGHPKAEETSNAALGLWVRCGSYCARNRTNGFITATVARKRGSAKESTELVRLGWWLEVDGGFRMHDWEQWQKTAEAVEHKSRVRSEAGRIGGQRSGATRRSKKEANASEATEARPLVVAPKQTNPAPSPSDLRSSELPTPPLPPNGGALVKEHLDAMKVRPPDRVVGQTAKIVGELLGEGIDERHIRGGLALLRQKAMHPSVLPSLVNEAMNPPQRIAKTDLAVLDGMNVAAELQARGM